MLSRCLILFALALPVKADEWLTLNLFVHAIDWQQTRQIVKSDTVFESNRLLGRNPTNQSVDTYFLLTGIIMIETHYLIPKKYRTTANVFYLFNGLRFVLNNHSIGVRFSI